MKRTSVIGLAIALALLLSAATAFAQADTPSVGDSLCGFTVTDVDRFELIGADRITYAHDKTGAKVLFLRNEDTNRSFQIAFRTPAEDDKGVSHVFEHATLDGSEKYPSDTLFFNLTAQTYSTYMNASTSGAYTMYPLASLSEEQLLKLADYYLDSVFHPTIMTDETFFREEAWRYALDDAAGELRIDGTVYSEMRGAYTLARASRWNYAKTLFPGSTCGNDSGGKPTDIPDMTWEDLTSYHDKYYHPSNSLTCLYGDIGDIRGFLSLLDESFSAYEPADIAIEDPGYQPIDGPRVALFEYGVEAGADTNNGAVVYYGLVCAGATAEQKAALDLLTTLLSDDASPYQQAMKEALPSASASCYVDNSSPEFSVMFSASGLNAEDADAFKALVDGVLADVAENGLDAALVDAVSSATRIATLLSTEGSSIGVDVSRSIAYYWATDDALYGYMDMIDNQSRFQEFAESGAYAEAVKAFLLDNELCALVTTSPVAGLKDAEDAALAEKLAGVKAEMTDEQIAAIVSDTAALAEPKQSDSSEYIAQLQAVTVDSLPEEARIYDVTDETGADGVRRIAAEANMEGVGTAYLLLNASGIPQEDLHWYKLYLSLLGELDSASHTRAELSAMITRYFYSPTFNTAAYDIETDETMTPYLRVSWTALDEDMQAGYDLLYEMLYETRFDDARRVLDYVSNARTSLKKFITDNSYSIQLYRAFAMDDPSTQYYNYISYLDYYDFLSGLETQLTESPEAALSKLRSVQSYFRNRMGAVSGFAGSAESAANHRAVADGFLARLDCAEIAPAEYTFPAVPASEALIVDAAVQFNMLYASYEQMGMEEFTADLDAVAALVSDMYLYPVLRDQYGAYSVLHYASNTGVYIVTYRDPNIAETFEAYATIPEKLAAISADQAALDGYILSAYSGYALSAGELSGALTAIVNTVSAKPQERALEYMRQLKAVKAEDLAKYAEMYRKLLDVGVISTSGGAAALGAEAERYEAVLNPFSVADATQVEFADVPADHPMYAAVRFAFENGLMRPESDAEFGAESAATMGDAALSMYVLLGGSGEPAEAVAYLSQYGIVPEGIAPETELAREDMAAAFWYFCQAVGMDCAPAEPLADATGVSAGCEDALAWGLEVGAISLLEDGSLAPREQATRAQMAYALAALFEE